MKSHFFFSGLALSLFVSAIVQAQTACFTLDNPKGCAPHTVNATNCAVGATGGVSYEFTSGGGFFSTSSNLYSGTGSFTVTQAASTSGGSVDFDIQTVTVITAVKPVTTVKTCSGQRVDVKINDNVYDQYSIDYGDGTVLTVAPLATSSHIYAGTATQTITVTGKFASGNSCGVGSITTTNVTPIATLPKPDITFLEVTKEGVANGEIEVHFNASSNFDYHFDLMTGTTSYPSLYATNMRPTMTNTSGAQTITLTGVNTLNEFQCLRIRANDGCTPGNFINNEICSIRSFNVQAQNLQNQLTWTAYPDATKFSSFDLKRDGNILANNASATTFTYIDNNVTCATEYCYQVQTFLNTTSSTGAQYSLSARKCMTAISTAIPTAVTNVNSSVNGSSIQVVFDAPTGFTVKKYQIFEANGNEVSNGTSTITSFASSAGKCYYVNYVDNCNNTSTTSPNTCTVNLNATLQSDGSIALTWSAYTGYTATGIGSYDVLLLDANGNIIKTIAGGSGFSASDIPNANAGSLIYMVRINSGGTENIISYSNKVEISLAPVVYIPNAFTPNSDGTNDVFEVKSQFVKSMEMSIYNRWGDPVFHSTDLNKGWDGKINGGDAPVDSYAYIIKIEGNLGESSTERGTISLVR